MKLVQINTVCSSSTGKIMGDIQREADAHGYDTISFVGRRKVFPDLRCEKIGNPFSFWLHVILTTAFDLQGYGSYFVTRKMVNRIRQENPDIIHLHNLHGYYLNLRVLFTYLQKEFQGKVFWTFHDCWPFTGHCPHFAAVECEKWREGCGSCPRKNEYPVSLMFDGSKRNYRDKKALFGGLRDLTILTPSEWMKSWVTQSFMGKYPVETVPNGIDLNIFRPRNCGDIYERYGICRERKTVLGVANVWDARKGLDDFVLLSRELGERYQIVLVGLSRRQIRALPQNIIGIERTQNQEELALLYNCADIFINPSKEESFSLVTIEAIACGTPVIVIGTSAVKELVDERNGIVIADNDLGQYRRAVEDIESRKYGRESVAETALKYDRTKAAMQVIRLYGEATGDK